MLGMLCRSTHIFSVFRKGKPFFYRGYVLVVLFAAGRAHQALVRGVLSDVTRLILWACRSVFLRELVGSSRSCAFRACSLDSCSSPMSSRRCLCWRPRRRWSGRVACRCAVRAGCGVRSGGFRRLDGEVGYHVGHVGHCRWVGAVE